MKLNWHFAYPLLSCRGEIKQFLFYYCSNFGLSVYRRKKEEVMSDNVAVVRELLAALERGDLPGAIQVVGEEVDWQSPVTRTHPP